MRDDPKSFKNLETLILTVSLHLIDLRCDQDSIFERDPLAFIKEVLNCIRILTRVLPFVYECDRLVSWEHSFFWEVSDNTRPSRVGRHISGESNTAETLNHSNNATHNEPPVSLGVELMDSLLDLAFWSGFTLPVNMNGKNGPTYGFWQSGIAYERRLDTSKEFESRRTEIMQLLLVLESKCIYKTASENSLSPCRHTNALTAAQMSSPHRALRLLTLSRTTAIARKYNIFCVPFSTLYDDRNRGV